MSISELYRAVSSPVGKSPSVGGDGPLPLKSGTGVRGPSEFSEILKKQELNFSQHAETRIKSREIPWDAGIEKRVSDGIDAAQKKGSRETLILADNMALIANVKSRTIITAMDRSQLKERIFTNIDSAVLV